MVCRILGRCSKTNSGKRSSERLPHSSPLPLTFHDIRYFFPLKLSSIASASSSTHLTPISLFHFLGFHLSMLVHQHLQYAYQNKRTPSSGFDDGCLCIIPSQSLCHVKCVSVCVCLCLCVCVCVCVLSVSLCKSRKAKPKGQEHVGVVASRSLGLCKRGLCNY